MIVVANAGPLIALARIGHFPLLHALFGELSVPPAVREEVLSVGVARPGADEFAAASWIRVVDVPDTVAVQLLRERLGAGESEAIVLAIQVHADLLLIDEARGRRVAEMSGLTRTGTIGVILAAKRRGLVQAATPLLDDLVAAGFRMSAALYRTALSLAAESS
jgi:hypothetical protein